MTNLDKLKTLIPMEEIEQSAQQQIYKNLEFDFLKTLAIMPDVHMGYTLPIGGVALLDNVISPEYCGYDIGCGVCCVITDVPASSLKEKDKIKIFNKLYETIPAGKGISRKIPIPYKKFKSAYNNHDKELNDRVNRRLGVQIGTLGSGNHFNEIGVNREGNIAISIHSGSRNPGHSVATFYMKVSKDCDKDLPKGFLHLNGELGQAYLQDMNFCLQYALNNRKLMMEDTLKILGFNSFIIQNYIKDMIDESHNHIVIKQDGVLHRKGATPAEKGVLGVIPGTMKSGVYVTKGLGNKEYLCSASHGAGRKMSRTKAKSKINLKDHKHWMNGIVAKVDKSTIDESHGAYKNLATVVSKQEGIVIDVVDYIKPLINVKG